MTIGQPRERAPAERTCVSLVTHRCNISQDRLGFVRASPLFRIKPTRQSRAAFNAVTKRCATAELILNHRCLRASEHVDSQLAKELDASAMEQGQSAAATVRTLFGSSRPTSRMTPAISFGRKCPNVPGRPDARLEVLLVRRGGPFDATRIRPPGRERGISVRRLHRVRNDLLIGVFGLEQSSHRAGFSGPHRIPPAIEQIRWGDRSYRIRMRFLVPRSEEIYDQSPSHCHGSPYRDGRNHSS